MDELTVRVAMPRAAALVQALFNLGEMVTATQSVGDDTLELLRMDLELNAQGLGVWLDSQRVAEAETA